MLRPRATLIGIIAASFACSVSIAQTAPTLRARPDPVSGTVIVQPLTNNAELTGATPTGTLTFTLHEPRDTNCMGKPVFSNVVSVNGNGIYGPSPRARKGLITEIGTYHWKVNYSGDANNKSAESDCSAGAVTITRPVLSIASLPENATVAAGTTATFTVVVKNLGPGTAKNASMSDRLPAVDVTWSTSTPNCSVVSSMGAPTLDCNLGIDFVQDATFTAVATAATDAERCTTMDSAATGRAQNAAAVEARSRIICAGAAGAKGSSSVSIAFAIVVLIAVATLAYAVISRRRK